MRTSPQGLAFIAREEGCVLHPYNDAHNYATIGVGHLIGLRPVTATDEKKYRGFTQQDAMRLLASDVTRFEAAVNRLVKVPLTQPQFDALVSFAFNCGEGGLQESQLLKDLNAGRKNLVGADLHHFDDGGLLAGRRTREGVLFTQGDYGPGLGTLKPAPVPVRRVTPPFLTWVAWRLGEGPFRRDGAANPKARPKVWAARVPTGYFGRLARFLAARNT